MLDRIWGPWVGIGSLAMAAALAAACDSPEKRRRNNDGGEGGEGALPASGGSGGTTATGGSESVGGSSTGGSSSETGGTGGTGGAGGTGGTGGGDETGGSGGSLSSGGSGGSLGGNGSGGTGGGTGGSLSTGGAAGTGGAGASSGTGPGAGGSAGTGEDPSCGSSWLVHTSGYVTSPGASGCWQGWAYTSASLTGTVTPADYSACTTPCSLCASGTVAADEDFRGIALLGFNLNQPFDTEVISTVVPTGSGITVSFTNTNNTPLRIQINGTNGDSDENARWCYALGGVSGTTTIPYSSFNTRCWDGTGYDYNREPLIAAQLLIPGSQTEVLPFDICMNGVMDAP